MASDYIRFNTGFEVVGGYLSPVSDAYKKVGLALGHHRVNMCSAAIAQSSWLMVDPFETVNCNAQGEAEYVPTAQVLRHFDHEINTVLGGIEGTDGIRRKARIALLAGADLVMSMGKISRPAVRWRKHALTRENRGAWPVVPSRPRRHPRLVWCFHHRALGNRCRRGTDVFAPVRRKYLDHPASGCQ